MNRADILEAIAKQGLGHLRPALEGVIRPAVRVTAPRVRPKQNQVVGSSRFGGLPDLPRGSTWPAVDGIRLAFAGQIDLGDIAGFEGAEVVPTTGLLSFFFDAALTGYGEGEAPDRSRVLYTDVPATALVRVDPPADVPAGFEVFPRASAGFEQSWTLPELEEIDGEEFPTFPAIVPIVQTAKDRKSYRTLRRKVRGPTIGSKLFGHADAVQGGEIVFDAIRRQDRGERFRYEDYEWTNLDALVAEMRDLCLLFQSAAGVSWGGIGVVYFWIRRRDLAERRFDRVFAMLSTT